LDAIRDLTTLVSQQQSSVAALERRVGMAGQALQAPPPPAAGASGSARGPVSGSHTWNSVLPQARSVSFDPNDSEGSDETGIGSGGRDGHDLGRPSASVSRDPPAGREIGQLNTMIREIRGTFGDSDDNGPDSANKTQKTIGALYSIRKQIDRHPERVVRDYTNDIRLKMGVQGERQYWRMVDWSRKLQPKFQRMSGMWRIHYY
jgi:hypothetical protein